MTECVRTDAGAPAPNGEAASAFAGIVFGYTDGFVPIRRLPEKGTPQRPVHTRFVPANAALGRELLGEAEAAAREGTGLFVVPGTVTQAGRAGAADVAQMAVVLVDLDAGDIAAMRAHLAGYLGQPSLEVASGGVTLEGAAKLHLYWRLTEAAAGADLAEVCRLRQSIAAKVGADPAFARASQPIRVPGSVHGKHGVKAHVRIVARSEWEYDLKEFVEAVAAMPSLSGLPPVVEPHRPAGPAIGQVMKQPLREGGTDGTTRYDGLSRIIGHWLRQARLSRVTLAEAWEAVSDHNAALIRPPWPEERLRREFEALLRIDRCNHGPSPEAGGMDGEPGLPPVPLSEDALAAAFATAHADHWKFVSVWGRWLTWTGTHWQRDVTGRAIELARQVCRAAAGGDAKPGEGRRLSTEKTIRAIERLARSDPRHAATPEEWDCAPMLLNTPAGILDLATGELLPHNPTARMTRLTRAAPGRGCPTWLRFLGEVTGGDRELVAYLARVAGYCLTGRTSEHAFFFLHGAGANGKSVLLAVLQEVLGSYATTAPLDSFMAARGERHPTDLAGLRGARLVSVTETEPGRTWAESRIKAITGGDSVSVRFMHQDFFEMRPELKLVISGNHRPRLSGVGEAMRRRLHLLPFDVTIAADRRDKRLIEKLVAERDGILGWMLAGCAEWQRIGLAPPKRVTDECASYFEDEDSFGQWIFEVCTTGPEQQSTSQALYASWSDWALSSGFQPGTQRDMAEQLKARGFRQKRTPHARCYAGLAPRHRSTAFRSGANREAGT